MKDRVSKGVFALCVLTAISAAWIPTPARARALRCDITMKQVCTTDGCQQIPAQAWNLIDLEKKTFSRCDNAGCDTYPANIAGPAEYLTLDMPGHGVVAKLGTTNGDFLEVATMMTVAYVSFGTCK